MRRFLKSIQRFWKQNWNKIQDINERYQTPRIEMSPAVRWTLLFLRFYLLFLVGLLVYKFITLI
jgi:hypothetical protein